MTTSNDKHGFTQIGVWIQEGIVLLLFFFYLFLRVHPVLVRELQSPVFLKGTDFLSEYLKIPGGLVDWFSALFMQFWFSDFLSALFMTFCLWMVALLTRKWIATLTENRSIHTFHLIPAGLLLVLHSQYDFRLSITLALIINLSILILFIHWAPKQQVIRAALSVAVAVLLYWITGGAFLIFVVLCGLDDLFSRKQIASSLLLLLISAVLPFAASASVFLVPVRQAYLHNLIFEDPIKLWIVSYSIPAFYLLALLIASLTKYFVIWKPFQKILKLAYIWKWVVGTLIILSGALLLAQKSYDDTIRLVFQVNRFMDEGQWTDVLKSVQHYPYKNPLLSCQTNLALFQMDGLLDSMFAYPQNKGTTGLLMNQTWCLAWPEEASNVCLKLGLVNESLHWAHEAFEHKGPTSNLLKRLGMDYMLKGEHDAANHYFLNLKNVPFYGNTAENLIRLNENPSELSKDSACKYIQSCMPTEDFISLGEPTSRELQQLLKRNPKNKMAFEYMIAYQLLNGNLREIVNHFSDFRALAYSRIPRHVQEALIFITSFDPKFDQNQLKNIVQPINYKRFIEYRQILINHKGDKNSAKQELQTQFGDTYWYYLMYVKLASQQSENRNEYQ